MQILNLGGMLINHETQQGGNELETKAEMKPYMNAHETSLKAFNPYTYINLIQKTNWKRTLI